jgi:hypothetical protein
MLALMSELKLRPPDRGLRIQLSKSFAVFVEKTGEARFFTLRKSAKVCRVEMHAVVCFE